MKKDIGDGNSSTIIPTIPTTTTTTPKSTTTTVLTTILQNLNSVTTEMTRVIYNSTTASTVEYTTITDSVNVTTEASPVGLLKAVGTVTQGTITTTTVTNGSRCTTTTTEEPFDEFGPPEGVEYIFVPLGVMIFVVVLTAVVLIISRRRKLERLRHRLMPLYNFDPGEEGEDDWETELLDEGLGNRQRRQGYQSMDNEENAELFSH